MKTNIERCVRCKLSKTPLPQPAPLRPLETPSGPNQRVHMDLFGPLRTSTGGNKLICVITDAFTKWAEIGAIENKEAQTVARFFFERWILRFSSPRQLVTDQGKEF